MNFKVSGLIIAVALILAFIDFGLVPTLVNRHDESRTDLIYSYQFSENNDTDLNATAEAVSNTLMVDRGLTDVQYNISAVPQYSYLEVWTDWIPIQNAPSFFHSINYTITTIQESPAIPQMFRVSHTTAIYDHTDVTMTFWRTHTVSVENVAWHGASLLFNIFIIFALALFYVQNREDAKSTKNENTLPGASDHKEEG